ncbi:MAG: hypothetical protein GTO41_01875, partial [Burkholderiales bacterium]|nr:hypothetical protein [Burkholderiales bacterium]
MTWTFGAEPEPGLLPGLVEDDTLFLEATFSVDEIVTLADGSTHTINRSEDLFYLLDAGDENGNDTVLKWANTRQGLERTRTITSYVEGAEFRLVGSTSGAAGEFKEGTLMQISTGSNPYLARQDLKFRAFPP